MWTLFIIRLRWRPCRAASKDPLATNEACVTGTLNVLHEAKQAGVKRVVYAASSSAYGDQPFMSKRELDLPAPAIALCGSQTGR